MSIVESIRAEYLRYKTLAESAIDQLPDDDLSRDGPNSGNSIAVLCWHIAGNLKSRFSDFLTSDGEKPWRQREEEFRARTVSRDELLGKWQDGWKVLIDSVSRLSDEDLEKTVTIRQQPLTVHAALHRSLSHTCYHVGQIVYIAKGFRGESWNYLSIAPGQSDTYNQAPRYETAAAQQAALAERIKRK
ncbi:MAG TPA: DUF1572 family protein [Gemmatimonadaceae bacterium]|nr:DUF1572 family protein [Gemmatimonadaceae bacterium]